MGANTSGDAVGTPWTGEAGVRETTADIMTRAEGYTRPPKLKWKTPKNRPRGHVNFENLLSDPASPPHAGEPSGPVAEAAGTASTSFTGATLYDTQALPPDSMGAVGPAQYLVAVNGRLRSFNKTNGVADGVLNANPDVFFSSVMTPPVANNFTSDPRIRYDRLSGRWFLIIIDVPGQSGTIPNRIMIAVSDGPVIKPSTGWTFYQFQHDLVTPRSNSDTGKFADYPSLGIDANALYIGVNLFGSRGQGSFANTTAFVVRKSSLLSGGPIVVTAFRELIANNPNDSGPYTPQGVDNYDPNATEGYFIGVDGSYYGKLQLLRVSNPGGTPSLSGNIPITIPINGNTINVPHLGNTNGSDGYLDGLDYRLLAAHIRNGRLWTAANIAVDNTGTSSGTDTRMGIRWYELGNLGTGETPALVQSGTIYQPSAGNTTDQRSYWMGSVMISGQGHALMGFSSASVSDYANAAYAYRLKSDASGSFRAPVLYTASSSAYNPASNPGGAAGRRWGDYSYTCLDPDDDMTMWTIQEWCNAPGIYAVQVVKVLAPPPATPLSCTPASLNQGTNNAVVTLLGLSDGETGFFDPGNGFSNRIAAAVSGSGVTVNSISYNNPTNVTLNLSVAAGATIGLRTVTVTNPDGQSAASSGGLLSIASVVATNHPPVLPAIADKTVVEGNLLIFTNTATDPDGNSLTYSLLGAPAGAGVTSTGVFTWTPGEAQGPFTNIFSLVVADNGMPSLSATQRVEVFVLESNRPPVLSVIPDFTLHAGSMLVFTNSATDPDLPANGLQFSLEAGAPPAAAIEALSGVFTWPTSGTNAGSTNSITVSVADNGLPALNDPKTFLVVVTAPPVIGSIMVSDGVLLVTWVSISGQTYRLQGTDSLAPANWLDVTNVTASSSSVAVTLPVGSEDKKFYRLAVEP